MSERELPVRASLENLRKQAKALHRAFRAGDADAMRSIRQHLPKAGALADEDLAGLDLSLQETQHVLAKEYGYATWEDLKGGVEAPLGAFCDLGREAFEHVLRKVEHTDVSHGLSGAPERVRAAFYACMSQRVALFIREEIEFLGDLPAAEVEAAQRRILDTARQVATEKGFAWPPPPAAPFVAVADLPKDDVQALLRATERADWIVAISVPAVTERVREAVLSCMSRRVAQEIMAEQEASPPSATAVAEAQARILEQVRRLADEGALRWPPEASAAGFSDLERLTDRETQVLMREVSQADLCRALVGAPEAVRGRVLGNMSQRVRRFLLEEGERLASDLPDHEPDASRQRILEWAEALGQDQRIAWPPPADREPWSGSMQDLIHPPRPAERPEDPLGGLGLEDLSIDDLARIFGELTSLAKREGMLALEEVANGRTLASEGLRLAVDGTQPALVESMLQARAETMLRNRRLRLAMMREGILALQNGTNPQLIWHQMQAHYLDPDEWQPSRRLNEAITGTELRDWIERGWLSANTPAEIAELFMHLGHAARNQGFEVLRAAAEAIEHPLLKAALTSAVEDRDHPEALQRQMQDEIDAEVRGLEARTRAVIAGVLGVMAGKDAEAVGADVRAAAASVDEATA